MPGYLSPDSSSRNSSLSTTPNHLRTPPDEQLPSIAAHPVPSGSLSLDRDQYSTSQDPSLVRYEGVSNRESSPTDQLERPELHSTATSVAISNQTSSHIILPSSSSHAASPCYLTKLDRCIVDMTVPTSNGAPFAGLTIKNVRQSLLLCGRVDGPAHITNVQDSVLVAKCRQFRMHDCRNVDVYLTCTSGPVIEDCSNIRFAKLPETYVRESVCFLELC